MVYRLTNAILVMFSIAAGKIWEGSVVGARSSLKKVALDRLSLWSQVHFPDVEKAEGLLQRRG